MVEIVNCKESKDLEETEQNLLHCEESLKQAISVVNRAEVRQVVTTGL